eukprot:gnl/MRDRNA2_/MRDRNA2_88700_c0_seq1.p1 gnl/MRDRNA2_/MRDRNA2_88700_c0~~gnl/MRDRNA2_/MRDRNA2_88700_c0_seq1.p1  ORF type:complete len:654 (+),score=244.27 gnl/MRDRNA2_/MRDRNA2_88700_c0_seq1:78-2039(+)
MQWRILYLIFVSVAALEVDNADSEKEWEKPIQKVIRLMKEMQSQLEKEAKEDEDMMDKLGCWCDTNEKEKTQANAINNQRITDLSAFIEESTAKSASLKTEIEELTKQVEASEASLAESTAIREKDAAEFFDFEKDSIVNTEAVKGAIMTLGKVHGSALDQQSLMQVRSLLRKHLTTHKHKSSKHLALIQEEPAVSEVDSLLQQAGEAPQSGAIFGILKQMKESFETTLATSTSEEDQAKETFSSMKASKEEEISAAEELIASKKIELASTDEKNAAAKEDLADTTATVDADTEFLANLKDKCDSATADYQARTKVRNEEIAAVGEAMEILTGDDAKDLLLKFVQRSSKTQISANRERAAKMVSQLAKKLNKPRLSALSMSMRLDAFTKVKEEIDKMVVSLKQTQKDEVVKKDMCGKELHENEMQTTEKTNLKSDLETSISDLETSKTTLAEEIAALKEEIAAAQTEMKRASEIRLAENKEFQMTIMDQKATQEILAKALNRLKDFYAKKSLLQLKSTRQPGYKKNAGSSSVMTMIEHIIEESKEEQKDTVASENAAVAAYAEFVADNNKAIESMSKSVVNKSEELAKVDENKAIAEGDLRATEADLLSLLKIYQTLHTDCDFLLKYFDVRQTKRAEEIEALQQAKAIFSGAK